MPFENKSLESLHSWVNPLKTVILLQHTFPIDPNQSLIRTRNEQIYAMQDSFGTWDKLIADKYASFSFIPD